MALATPDRAEVANEAHRSEAKRRSVDVQVVIPTFNEEQRIGGTLEALVRYLDVQPWRSSVVVVDNGSSDATVDAVDRIQAAHSLRRSTSIAVIGCASQGKGAAVRRGMLTGASKWVGFCDADGATPFDAIGAAINELKGGADMVVGSRRIAGAAYVAAQPLDRRLAGALFRYLVRSITSPITDTQCGFKFFTRAAALNIFSRSCINGFAFDVEVIAIACGLGYRIVQLPVEWSDVDGSTLSIRVHGRPLLRDVRQLRAEFSSGAFSPETLTPK